MAYLASMEPSPAQYTWYAIPGTQYLARNTWHATVEVNYTTKAQMVFELFLVWVDAGFPCSTEIKWLWY